MSENTEIKARPYQTRLLEKALEEDVIIYLKTGSGKTFIAVRLIQEICMRDEREGRVIFLADTVPLILQQAEYMRRFVSYSVGEYYGEKRLENKILDSWDQTIWTREIESNRILVMGPAILNTILEHGFIKLDQIKLIVFDECHRATGNHPYSQVLAKCREASAGLKKLGLTASIVTKKCNLDKFIKLVNELENVFKCKVATESIDDDAELATDVASQILAYRQKPVTKLVGCKTYNIQNSELYHRLKRLQDNVKLLDEKFVRMSNQATENLIRNASSSSLNYTRSENTYRVVKQLLGDLLIVYEELGVWYLSDVFDAVCGDITSLLEGRTAFTFLEKSEINQLVDYLSSVKSNLINPMIDGKQNAVFDLSTDKVKSVLNILRENHTETDFFHAIVFVNNKILAIGLKKIIDKLIESNTSQWGFIKCDYIYGETLGSSKRMNANKQKEIMDQFRKHEINVLIATNIIEEGVDVPACNLVVRFNRIPNVGSFIQSKGRARAKNSKFYIISSEVEFSEYQKEVRDFLEIERYLETEFINCDPADRAQLSEDEVERLNQLIQPYVKGHSRITCLAAISLIERYCATLESGACGIQYPIYHFKEHLVNSTLTSVFSCSMRLPPNSVMLTTLKSGVHKRKQYSKMAVALEMCKELDRLGELDDNLIPISKESWVTEHYKDKESSKDVVERSRKQYDISVIKALSGHTIRTDLKFIFKLAKEFKDNHPAEGVPVYLYRFVFQDNQEWNNKLGFLSSKPGLEQCSSFELYKDQASVTVRIELAGSGISLTSQELDTLKQLHQSIFQDLLRVDGLQDFSRKQAFGGFVVFVTESGQVDWDFIRSRHSCQNLRQGIREYGFDAMKNKIVKFGETKRLMIVIELSSSTPTSQFVNLSQAKTFVDYFKIKHMMDTEDLDHPLVQVEYFSFNIDYTSKVSNAAKNKDIDKKKSAEALFIAEHLLVIPFEKSLALRLALLPSVFYRINSLLRARELRVNIETKLRARFPELTNEAGSWSESIKFHKRIDQELSCVDDEMEQDSTLDYVDKNHLLLISKPARTISFTTPVPDLVIHTSLDYLPNDFHILQCLTLKSANDDFDLERYELLGDCFLKLTVVVKIYVEFFDKNEGKMAELKSMRVSNRYLYNLARGISLSNYVVSKDFIPRENWIGPNMSIERFDKLNKLNFLSDKSLADCVEGLIGLYLMKSGINVAKGFIESLDYVISDKTGKTEFKNSYEFPDPLSRSGKKVDDELKCIFRALAPLEQQLGYSFNNKVYLYQALTHPSYTNNTHTTSYQKLELVGDAVLDILVTQYIFSFKEDYSPGELTSLRKALVNNKFFAHLVVKHNLDKYLNHSSPGVFADLDKYRRAHEEHPPDAIYLGSENGQDEPITDDYELDAPKFLADLFESIAGAIYLDSNESLESVWRCYFPMLSPYFVSFRNNIPKSPIEVLHQLKPQSSFKYDFHKDEKTGTILASLQIDDNVFQGSGASQSAAKNSACKAAVRSIAPNNKDIIFF